MSMDEYAKHSNHRRSNRRSSLGCCADLMKSPTPYHNRPKMTPWDVDDTEEGEELSECSTIISSLELSGSSLHSQEVVRRPAAFELPFPLEEEEETSGHALKDSILHKYDKSYMSPSPTPKKDRLKVTAAMQQKLRFRGLEQALESPQPLTPGSVKNNKPDRRKMFSRWASTGHMCPTDDECEPADKAARDKPPTSPVRKSRGKLSMVPGASPSLTSEKKKDKAPSSPNRHRRRASTGVMADGGDMVVKLSQEKGTFEPPASPKKNDVAPTCPDRRSQFRRRNSTGSSESLDKMLIFLSDDEDAEIETAKHKSKSEKRKSRNHASTSALDYKHSSSDKSSKKKSKKKSSKDKKEKSSKKKDKSSKTSGSSSSKKSSSSDPRESLQTDSLLSMLGKSTSTLLPQSTRTFEAATRGGDHAMSRPMRTFSRWNSTGVLTGEGIVMMPKMKKGGTTEFSSSSPSSPYNKSSLLALSGVKARKFL